MIISCSSFDSLYLMPSFSFLLRIPKCCIKLLSLIKHSTGKYIFPRNDYTITPTEATLKGKALSSSLVVFPYSFKLGLKAFLNGQKVATYPVYNGGMTGIFVSKGDFDLKLIVPFSWYFLTMLMQFFYYFCFFLYLSYIIETSFITG